ncbi:MAG TPA: ABC-F family ATP-binding cassette domain-containing protein [Anaerolineales bacterium]|nr:ABC-F family ATP-binding cassette domain-containing protein [Anaerolineales bacterium]
MIAISLSNLTLILGARAIFRELNWEIQHDQKVGLIGPNGAGKSSIFKLIVGEYTPEPGGAIVRVKGVSVGYLSQQPEFDPACTAYGLALAGNPRYAEVETELARLESLLSLPSVYNDPNALTRTLEQQQKALGEFEAMGGAGYPKRVREILLGLGLPEADLEKPIGLLSGGQKKLVGLARLMMAKPGVLLLDEPDNHLDLPAKAFLERLIVDYPGAVVLVSHDRYLLDSVVTHIAEIEDGRLTTMPGNYSTYILDKQERLQRQEELYQIQQRDIARLQMALKRYKLWVQVSDKFASRVRSMETHIARIKEDARDRPVMDRRKMGLELNGFRGSNQVLELIGLQKSFGPARPILKGVNLLVRHGERVGLIGPNGTGKSVLLRLILGKDEPDAGEVRIGPSVRVGYYAQEHETLDQRKTLIDTLRLAGNLSEANAVALLIRYLFTYQQASQKVSELSGGERSRLQLALLVLSGANFLLLDEPTNNLDIASAEVLENALADFIGTVLVISHDRYFLDRTVDRIVLLHDGTLKEYIGGYSDYAGKAEMEARLLDAKS